MSAPAPGALSPPRAHALMHVTVVLWGFTAILGRLISLTAVALVWYRLLLVVGMMAAVIASRRLSFRLPLDRAWRLAGIGVLVAIHWLLFYGCIKYAGVAVAVLCLSSITLFTALLEPVVFRRRVITAELLIGALVMVGIGVLVKVEAGADLTGLAMGLGSALFSAAFGTLNGKYAREVQGEVLTFFELAAAAVVTTAAFAVWPQDFVAPSSLSARDAVLLVVLAFACTVVPWLWSLRVLRTLSPYTLALAVSLEPVYAMAVAYVAFPDSEQLTGRFYGGTAVLLGLVVLNTVLKRRRV